MKTRTKHYGFSLTEVLMAVGILMVGLLMVAGTFPVGIHLTAVSTERTLGAIAADEAFAKVQLYGVDTFAFTSPYYCEDFNDVADRDIDGSEFLYPSDTASGQNYNWSAICRKVNTTGNAVQVTVFVSRLFAPGLSYYENGGGTNGDKPVAILIDSPVPSFSFNSREVSLANATDYITDKSFIVIDRNGEIFRVVEVGTDSFWLDRAWPYAPNPSNNYEIWTVPPSVSGGKSPCVGVYQRIINF